MSDSRTAVGNILLGIEFRGKDAPFFAELSARLPSASDNAGLFTGLFGDLVDRQEAFLPHIATVAGALNYRHANDSGFRFRLRMGPTLLMTEDFDDTELYFQYGAQAWYENPNLEIGGGLSGRVLATGGGDLGDQIINQRGAGVVLKLSGIRPGLNIRIPLDDELSEVVNFAVGLNVTLPLL